MRMYVHCINVIPTQIVWKWNLDKCRCKIRHSGGGGGEIDDMAAIVNIGPIRCMYLYM